MSQSPLGMECFSNLGSDSASGWSNEVAVPTREIYGATGAGILLSGRYKEMTNKVSTSEPIEITDDYNRLEWTWIGGLIFRPNVLDKKLFLEFRTGSSFTSMVKEDVFGAKVFNPYQQIMVGYSFGE